MKNQKIKKITYKNEDVNEIRTLIIITLIIVVIAGGLYFFTEKILDNKNTNEPKEETPAAISYTNIILGTIFDMPEDEYFVFAYSSEAKRAAVYNGLMRTYNGREDSLKIYYVDLNDGLNRYALSDDSNTTPKDASEIRINEMALIRIKNGKVKAYYETEETITNALK